MSEPKKNGPKRISARELAAVGLDLVSRAPLIVCCQTCGVEWRPAQQPGVRRLNQWWRCQNGCNSMEQPQRFQSGDRVRTTHPLVSLPVGSSGTVERALSAGNLYDLRFDGESKPRVIHRDYLELAERQEQVIGD